jgi:AraC-like DNA-binding protein
LTFDYGLLMRRLLYRQLPGRRHHCHAAITRLAPGVTTFTHTHDFPECFLVLAGGGWHCGPGGRVALAPGHLVWVEATDTHWFATEGAPLEFANLAVDPAWWRAYAALTRPRLRSRTFPRLPVALRSEARARLESNLPLLLGEDGERGERLLSWVAQAVEALAPAPAPAGGAVAGAPPAWLAALLDDLARGAHLAEPIGWWQRRSGRSKEHLARACRRYCGASLTELLQRARLARAQRLLAQDEAKVTAVAFEAGFGHLGHFHTLFKRATGLTPRAWQRRHAATVPRPA